MSQKGTKTSKKRVLMALSGGIVFPKYKKRYILKHFGFKI